MEVTSRKDVEETIDRIINKVIESEWGHKPTWEIQKGLKKEIKTEIENLKKDDSCLIIMLEDLRFFVSIDLI